MTDDGSVTDAGVSGNFLKHRLAANVQRAMNWRMDFHAWCGLIVLVVGIGAGIAGRAAENAPAAAGRDTLVYKDGDRVQGKLVEQAGGILVFKSERFGELRVPAADAVVIKAGQPVAAAAPVAAVAAAVPVAAPAGKPATPAPPVVAAKPAAKAVAEPADPERLNIWERFSPEALTARVRRLFGPWRGRFSFSAEVVTDIAKRNNSSYEALVRRKWATDEVQFNARYDYSETNNITTTDLVKITGQWRHDFSKSFFMQYRPSSEWNRASQLRGLPNDYVLLQQELGAGFQIVTKPSFKARIGLSQNRFDTWNSAVTPDHIAHSVRSLFEEMEISLPWRMTIAQRGVWYPVPNQTDGWENRFDLNKKLTETLSASLRHEIRRYNPDGSAPDYTRLKLLFGLDF